MALARKTTVVSVSMRAFGGQGRPPYLARLRVIDEDARGAVTLGAADHQAHVAVRALGVAAVGQALEQRFLDVREARANRLEVPHARLRRGGAPFDAVLLHVEDVVDHLRALGDVHEPLELRVARVRPDGPSKTRHG